MEEDPASSPAEFTEMRSGMKGLGHRGPVTGLAWPDASAIYSGSLDWSAAHWDAEREARVCSWAGSAPVTEVAFSKQHNVLATACSDRKLRFYDPRVGEALTAVKSHRAHGSLVSGVSF